MKIGNSLRKDIHEDAPLFAIVAGGIALVTAIALKIIGKSNPSTYRVMGTMGVTSLVGGVIDSLEIVQGTMAITAISLLAKLILFALSFRGPSVSLPATVLYR